MKNEPVKRETLLLILTCFLCLFIPQKTIAWSSPLHLTIKNSTMNYHLVLSGDVSNGSILPGEFLSLHLRRNGNIIFNITDSEDNSMASATLFNKYINFCNIKEHGVLFKIGSNSVYPSPAHPTPSEALLIKFDLPIQKTLKYTVSKDSQPIKIAYEQQTPITDKLYIEITEPPLHTDKLLENELIEE